MGYPPPPPPGYYTAPPPAVYRAPGTAPLGPDTRAPERRAVSQLRTAAIIGLVGFVVGWGASAFYDLAYAPRVAFVPGVPGGASLRALEGQTGLLLALIGVGLAFLVVSTWFYRTAFLALRPLDGRFGTPSTLSILLIVGVILLLLGLVVVLATVEPLANCLGSSTRCAAGSLGGLLGGLALLGIGGILAIIGYIGTGIGIYRFGSRYSSTLLKAAGIFFVIPYLNLVGAILTLVEASEIERRLDPPFGYGPRP